MHMRNLHCEKKFTCNVCDYKTSNIRFQKHKHCAKVECPVCKKEVSNLKAHLSFHKPKESCPICERMIHKHNLKKHLESHARGPQRVICKSLRDLVKKGNEGLKWSDPHTCSICGKVYRSSHDTKKHIESCHWKAIKWFCDLCPIFYFSRAKIYRHMKSAHLHKKFACNVCDYKADNRKRLQEHYVIHSTKVECPICKKSVTSLNFHMKTHQQKENCSICKRLISKKSLKSHMRIHQIHPKCEECDEVFTNKKDFRR